MPDKEKKFLKTVAAFAHGAGGIILLGVADDGKVEGVKGDVARYMDGVSNSIHNGLTPQPAFHLERCEVDHRQVIGVFVAEGKDARTASAPSRPPFTCAGRGRPSTRPRLRSRRSRSRISRSRIITVTTAFTVEQLR